MGRVAFTVAAVVLGLMLFSGLRAWTNAGVLTIAGTLAATVPGVLAIRWGYARWPAVGWIAGLTLPSAAFLLAYAFYAIRGFVGP